MNPCKGECSKYQCGIKVTYGGFTYWCRNCGIPLVVEGIITMNGKPVKRCICCHAAVRHKPRDPKRGEKMRKLREAERLPDVKEPPIEHLPF